MRRFVGCFVFAMGSIAGQNGLGSGLLALAFRRPEAQHSPTLNPKP